MPQPFAQPAGSAPQPLAPSTGLAPQPIVQLIAPARTLDGAPAAIGSGATAVHFDLRLPLAANTVDAGEIERTARLAHANGAQYYLFADMIVLPDELDRFAATLHAGWEAGADGVVVSDLGLLDALREMEPEMRLHLGGRANVHDASTLRAYASLGVARIALARELPLREIQVLAAVAAEAGVEVEVLVHGPSCLSYAGQCVFSAMTGQGSDNRGRCAGLCRARYELVDLKHEPLEAEGPYLLSTKDTALYDHVAALATAGVAALRIGGSDRTSGATAAVTATYRAVFDDALAGRAAESAGVDARLSEAFNRGHSDHMLKGERTLDALAIRRPHNAGVMIGRVSAASGNRATLAITTDLSDGDIIEVRTRRGSFTQEVNGLEGIAPAGSLPTIRTKSYSGKGDRVFRLRSAALEAAASTAAARAKAIRITLEFDVAAVRGEPFAVSITDSNGVHGYAYGAVVEDARTKPLTTEEVAQHVDRLGNTAYRAGAIRVTLDDGVGLRFSDIHRVRTAAIADYEQNLSEFAANTDGTDASVSVAPREEGAEAIAQVAAPAFVAMAAADRRSMFVAASVEAPGGARAAMNAGAATAFAPAYNLTEEEPTPGVSVLLPRICADDEFDTYLGTAERFGSAVASTLGQLVVCAQRDIPVSANSSFNVTNARAARVLATMGAELVWLSPELSGNQVAEVAVGSPVPVGITVGGLAEVLVSEHCILMAAHECDRRCDRCKHREQPVALRDDKGYTFPLRVDPFGRSHLYNSVPLDLSRQLAELVKVGVAAVRTDLSTALTSSVSGEVAKLRRQVTDAYAGAEPEAPLPHTTTGRYYRSID